MYYRYEGEGKTDPTMRKNGKHRRQAEAKGRKAESTVRDCGHAHTDNGARHCRHLGPKYKG